MIGRLGKLLGRRDVPLRLDCLAPDDEGGRCGSSLYMSWPELGIGWSATDMQAALPDGWTLYEVDGVDAGDDGESCVILVCPKCAKSIGEGFERAPDPPSEVQP